MDSETLLLLKYTPLDASSLWLGHKKNLRLFLSVAIRSLSNNRIIVWSLCLTGVESKAFIASRRLFRLLAFSRRIRRLSLLSATSRFFIARSALEAHIAIRICRLELINIDGIRERVSFERGSTSLNDSVIRSLMAKYGIITTKLNDVDCKGKPEIIGSVWPPLHACPEKKKKNVLEVSIIFAFRLYVPLWSLS